MGNIKTKINHVLDLYKSLHALHTYQHFSKSQHCLENKKIPTSNQAELDYSVDVTRIIDLIFMKWWRKQAKLLILLEPV